MRLGLTLGVLIAWSGSEAAAQTLIPNSKFFGKKEHDDNGAETHWKVNMPTGAGDAFNVDFDQDANGLTIFGVGVGTSETGPGGAIEQISVCPDLAADTSGATPDVMNPFTFVLNPTGLPGFAAGFCPVPTVFDLPDVTISPTEPGIHAVVSFPAGDSVTWLCADTSSMAGRSYFTSDDYVSSPVPFTGNWIVNLACSPPMLNGGDLIGNFGRLAQPIGQLEDAAWTFWASSPIQPTLYLQALHIGVALLPLPSVILATGLENFAPWPLAQAGTLHGQHGCAAPPGLTTTWSAFFADNGDLKKNGAPRIKLTPDMSYSVTASPACTVCLCYGLKDDTQLDTTVWAVQNPSGSQDWFNVKVGTNPACATQLTAIEAASWDFCGTGPCWGDVGVYPANLVLDPTGGSPNPVAPVSVVSGASACMTPGATDWGYPATLYDVPDVAADTTTLYHVAVHWSPGDSCTWIASDTDGTDDDAGNNCGVIPSTASYFSADGYVTPGIPFTIANWMMKLDWN